LKTLGSSYVVILTTYTPVMAWLFSLWRCLPFMTSIYTIAWGREVILRLLTSNRGYSIGLRFRRKKRAVFYRRVYTIGRK